MNLDQLDSKCVQHITYDDIINLYERVCMCACVAVPLMLVTGACFLAFVHHCESQTPFELKNNDNDETHITRI